MWSSETIKDFVDNGNLSQCIYLQDFKSFPHIRFVSLNTATMVVSLLVCGQCPNCGKENLRNTCTTSFTKKVLSPILLSKFRDIRAVVPVLTTDSNLVPIISSVGGQISFPFRLSLPMRLSDLKLFLLASHPDIDTLMSVTLRKSNTSPSWSENEYISAIEYLQYYTPCWFIDTDSKVFVNNQMYEGRDALFSVPIELLPEDIEFRTNGLWLACNTSYFDQKKYVVINFPNGYR